MWVAAMISSPGIRSRFPMGVAEDDSRDEPQSTSP